MQGLPSEKGDVWSLGVLGVIMLTKFIQSEYDEDDLNILLQDLIKKEGPCLIKETLLKMVVADPVRRASVSDLLRDIEAQ